MLGDHNYHVLQDTLITLCQVTLKNNFYAKLLKIQDHQVPNTSVYGCVSLGNKLRPRIQIMSADLPRQALVKSWKKLSSMSSSKSWGPQAAFLNRHYDNSWCSMASRVDPACSCCRGSIFHHNNSGGKGSHDGSSCVGSTGYKVIVTVITLPLKYSIIIFKCLRMSRW